MENGITVWYNGKNIEIPLERKNMGNMEIARETLEKENCTCVAFNGEKIVKSFERGVKPLLEMIDEGTDLSGYSAADRVVGRAAAFLYVKLKISEVYSYVLSRPAIEIFNRYRIPVRYEKLVDVIVNRTNTGLCPMESSVMDTNDPEEAERKIRKKLSELASGR